MTDLTNPTPDVPIDESDTPLQSVDGGRLPWLPNVEVVHPLRKPQPTAPSTSE